MRALAVDMSASSSLSLKRLCCQLSRDPVVATLPTTLALRCGDNGTGDEVGYSILFSKLRRLEQLRISAFSMSLSTDWMLKVGPSIGHSLRKLVFCSGHPTSSVTLPDPTSFFQDLVVLEELSVESEHFRFGVVGKAWPDGAKGLSKLRTVECSNFHQSVLDALASFP